MPRSISMIYPGAANTATRVQNYAPVAPHEGATAAPAVPAAPAARVEHARGRMAELRLPATPAERFARRTNATFAAGLALLGSGTVMAFIPVARQQLADDISGSTLETVLAFTASAALTCAGRHIMNVAADRDVALDMQQQEGLSATEPCSPTSPAAPRESFAIERRDAAASDNTPAEHDIENPPPRANRQS